MARHSNKPESCSSASLLTIPISELIQTPEGVFNPSSPEYLFEHIQSETNFISIFAQIDGEIGANMRDCKPEDLVEAVLGNEDLLAIESSHGLHEKRLCRYLEDTLELAQSIKIVLAPDGRKPLRATIKFNSTLFNDRMGEIRIGYGQTGEKERMDVKINILGNERQEPIDVKREESRTDEVFISCVSISRPVDEKPLRKQSEISLERKISLMPQCRKNLQTTYRIYKRVIDIHSKEILSEESKSISDPISHKIKQS